MFFLLLLVLPVVEIAVFIKVGSALGVGTTLLLVLASAVLGIALVRTQGFAAASRVQAMIGRGESPALEMLEGLALLAAGVLFLIPGFVTDVMAFFLVIPPMRRYLIRQYMRRFRIKTTVTTSSTGGTAHSGPPPIEGEARRED